MKPASYPDLHLEMYGKGKSLTKLYDKRGDFSVRIVNLSTFLSSVSPAYGVLKKSYHNFYVMPKLAVTTQTFCIVLDFLKLATGTELRCYKIEVNTTEVLWTSL